MRNATYNSMRRLEPLGKGSIGRRTWFVYFQ